MNSYPILTECYSISGIIITCLYVPQLIKVMQAQTGLEEISISTWSLWSICMVISASYSFYVPQDIKLTLVSLAGAYFCALIAFTTFCKRLKYNRSNMETSKNGTFSSEMTKH